MLFEEQVARKPNLYPWTQEFIDRMWAGFWTPNEFEFAADYSHFKTLMTEEEQGVTVRALSAIGQIEIAVKTFWAKLGENLPHPSLNDLGIVMGNSEVIHNIAYEKLLDRLRLNDVFEENLKNPIIAGRVKYLRKYLKRVYGEDKRKQYIYAIILFTLFVENVSLFSQFYVILWFNRNKEFLKDAAQQVQYTRNEEMLHAQVGIKIIQTLRYEYPELFDQDLIDRIRHETEEALIAESKVIDWIMGDYRADGLNPEILKNYVKSRLDDSLTSIGFPRVFNDIDPELLQQSFWMDEELLGNNRSDFFWKKPVEYAKNNRSYNEEDLF